jgi:hypothetical protein
LSDSYQFQEPLIRLDINLPRLCLTFSTQFFDSACRRVCGTMAAALGKLKVRRVIRRAPSRYKERSSSDHLRVETATAIDRTRITRRSPRAQNTRREIQLIGHLAHLTIYQRYLLTSLSCIIVLIWGGLTKKDTQQKDLAKVSHQPLDAFLLNQNSKSTNRAAPQPNAHLRLFVTQKRFR